MSELHRDSQVSEPSWASIAAIGICLRDEANKCVNSPQRERLHRYASRLVELAREAQDANLRDSDS